MKLFSLLFAIITANPARERRDLFSQNRMGHQTQFKSSGMPVREFINGQENRFILLLHFEAYKLYPFRAFNSIINCFLLNFDQEIT